MSHISSKKKAHLAAEAALDKKADRVVILEMKNIFPISDYFLIASGENARKVKAIADSIQEKLGELDIGYRSIEGLRDSQWVLLDYNDVVVHVFLTAQRDFYDLEHLWGDAPRVTIDAPST